MAKHFFDISNQARSGEPEKSFMQKPIIPLSPEVEDYLTAVGRYQAFPVAYTDLLHYRFTDAVRDEAGKLTHWERLSFTPEYASALYPRLLDSIRLLEPEIALNGSIGVIDICEYGNSNPFRIQLRLANGADRWYFLKQADCSRLLGLELAHLLGTQPASYLAHEQTVLEAAIEGMPGDQFLRQRVPGADQSEKTALARAFVRFCQQAYGCLLGDMRHYNFVVRTGTVVPQLLPIDFDQQLHEGFPSFYSPQYFRENLGWVELVESMLTADQILAVEEEERDRWRNRFRENQERLHACMQAFSSVTLSERHQIRLLVQAWYPSGWPEDSLPSALELLEYHWQQVFDVSTAAN